MKRLITLCLLGSCFLFCSRTELCIPSLGTFLFTLTISLIKGDGS